LERWELGIVFVVGYLAGAAVGSLGALAWLGY
jgi:hypothetical protein